MEAPATFTAAQFASALGKTPQAVRKQLREIRPAGVRIVAGNEAAAWTVAQLPIQLRQRLADEATRQNCRTVDALLAMPRQQWQPAIPIGKIADADIQVATKLRDVLKPWLIDQHNPNLSTAEMESRGIEDYRRVFGNRITARYWRELFMRTLRRDNGAEQWNRLEIYLGDRLKQKDAPASVVSEALAADFAEVESFIAACTNPHAPNKTECSAIWTLAFEKFNSLVNSGQPEKSAARLVRQFLFARASFLAASRDALLKAFNRKLEALQAAGGDVKALRDGREENGANFELPIDDRDLLIACAKNGFFGRKGEVPAAWRNLILGKNVPVMEEGRIFQRGFSKAVLERYTAMPAKKSYVPTSVINSVAAELEVFLAMDQGPRAFDAIKGYVTRSYDGICSLQCISGDDVTMPVYMSVPDGGGWYGVTRGQLLLFIDFRTGFILGWALEPRKSYSSLTIRSQLTHIGMEYGMPDVLYFERGIWKSATLLKGKTDPFTFTEISHGLREFGVQFKHAIRPRTKTVERIIGIFQSLCEGEPGYCGRDERRDCPESLRPQIAAVEMRKVHPSKHFYTLDQWNRRIGELVSRYNSEPQQGHMLAGLSPEQAFQKYMDPTRPTIQFSPGLRYMLAHDKRPARVTLNGVTIQVGKTKFNYRGREIAHLVGREVLAWFDPENPEFVVITNPDRANPITVGRSENPNALESLIAPESGALGRSLAGIEGQASYMKTRFNVVKAKFPLPSRMLLGAAQKLEFGEEIAAQKIELTEKATRRQRQRGHANKLAERTGVFAPERAQDNLQPDDVRFLSEFLHEKEIK